ncbi:MAG: class I SAM-dependent methyltransferase [Pseudomonadota bacterium]
MQETLLIPLLGRAVETRKGSGLIHDPHAVEIVEQLDYDFAKWEDGPSMFTSVLRTRMLDDDVREFLERHPKGTVVEIGCGLNDRFQRVDNGQVRWFDMDLPDTIELRRHFFDDSARQTMLTASVLETDWIAPIKDAGGPYCFVSEAVLIYLEGRDAEQAIGQIITAFPGAWLLMDTTSRALVESQAKHDAMKHLPQSSWFRWQVDEPEQLESLGLRLVRSRLFADAGPELIRRLPLWIRVVSRWMPWLARRLTKGYRLNCFVVAAS